MSRLTRQEQFAIWILLLLMVGGGVGRYLIRHRTAEPPGVAAHR